MRARRFAGASLALWLGFGCGAVSADGDPDAAAGDASSEAALLSSLAIAGLTLAPPFDPAITEYTVVAPFFTDSVSVTAAAPSEHFISIAGSAVNSGVASPPINLSLGGNVLAVEVVSFERLPSTYSITVSRGQDVLEYVKASNTESIDQFGIAVATTGDLLAIGATAEASGSIGINGDQNDNSVAGAGAVYVFSRDGASWAQEAYIKPLVVDAGDAFGRQLAIDGDTLVVSSVSEDSSAVGAGGNANDNGALTSGAAWVFVRDGAGTWTQQAYLKASNTGAADSFGDSVAISGDTIAVGAPNEDSAATGVGGNQLDNAAANAGAVYIFLRQGATWSQQAYLKASNTGASDLFGQAVALDGDTLVVGADGEDSAATGVGGNQVSETALSAGAAYVFVRSGVVWSQQAYLKASNTEQSDVFGRSVSISGDTVAVSAEGEDSTATGVGGNQADNGAPSSGAVYIFLRSAGQWSQQAYLKASNTAASDLFASQLVVDGDALLVTASLEDSAAIGLDGNQADNTSTNAGAAYVFRRLGDQWRQTNFVKAGATDPSDNFGTAAALADGLVVIGTRLEDGAATGVGGDPGDNSANAAGAAFIFE